MLALFVEIFLFILIAVVVGFIIGWLMRGRFGVKSVSSDEKNRLKELEQENAEYQKIVGEYDSLNEKLEKDKLRLEAELSKARRGSGDSMMDNAAVAGAAGLAASETKDAFAVEAEVESAKEEFYEELEEVKTETIDLEEEGADFNLSNESNVVEEAVPEVADIELPEVPERQDIDEIVELEIEEIEGIGKSFGNALRDKGIATTADLLRFAGRSLERREELSEHVNINISVINSWVGMADLLRIPSVDKQEAELLYDAGVLNTKYLRDFEGVVLVEKLDKLNDNSPIEQPVPLLEEAKIWIESAKNLDTLVD